MTNLTDHEYERIERLARRIAKLCNDSGLSLEAISSALCLALADLHKIEGSFLERIDRAIEWIKHAVGLAEKGTRNN